MVKTSLPLVLLTRPRAAAERFAEMLLAARSELDVLMSPIMEIVYLVPERLPAADVVLFTSVHGVAGYVAAGGAPSAAYCVGSVTAEKARKAGFGVLQVAPDLAGLRPALAGEQRKLLQVRGTYVTADLATEFAHMASVIVYDQPRVALTMEATLALASGRAVVVPLFSPRSARAFAEEAGQPEALYAAYISEAVKAAAELPCIEAEMAQTPDAQGMVAAILRLIDKV